MNWLERTTIKQRLIFVILLPLFFLCVSSIALLNDKKDTLLKDRKHELRTIIQVAESIVTDFQIQAQTGELPEKEAKSLAIRAMDALRYGDQGYISLFDNKGTMINHPFDSSLIGKDLSSLQDVNGTFLIRDTITGVAESKYAYVPYYWPKPNQTEPLPKIACATEIKNWGWVLSTGVYVDDVDEQFVKDATNIIVIIICIAVFLFFINYNITNSILKPIRVLTNEFNRIAENRDLTQKVVNRGNNELGKLASSFNYLLENFSQSILAVQHAAKELLEQFQTLSQTSDTVAQSSSLQSQAATSLAAAVEEFSCNIVQLAENASSMRDLSTETGRQSQEGDKTFQKAVDQMQSMASDVQRSGETIRELDDLSGNIQNIITVIQEVAEQTNLLALNAAIEAARAGEQGRGFAVVADEVRQLAARTSDSSGQISGTVKTIREGSQKAVSQMKESVDKVNNVVEHASESQELIKQLHSSSENLVLIINQVTEALEEQKLASEEMTQRITDIADTSANNQESSAQAHSTISHLLQVVKDLEQNTARFKLG